MDVAGTCGSIVLLASKLGLRNWIERQSFSHGFRTVVASDVASIQVSFPLPLPPADPHSDALPCRDPTQHSALKDEIEEQSTALYASARLWDDGIIKPTDTRDVVGLGLSLAKKQRLSGKSNTWDGSGNGFGVFRM